MRNSDIHALITATVTQAAPIDAMLNDAGAALNAHGILTRVLLHADGFANPNLMKALVVGLRDSGMASFIMNINAKDELIIGEKDGRAFTIHDAWSIPLVAWMVDHPATHLPFLLRAPENAVIGVIDEGHLAFLRDSGLAPRTHIFCPHGGPEPIPDMPGTDDRPIDLLFVGNLADPGPLAPWLDRHAPGNPNRRAALTDAHDAVTAGQEVYQALSQAFQRVGENAHPHALAPLITALDAFVTQTRRIEVLAAITRRRVTILGELSPEVSARLSHHDLRGSSMFARALSLMASAKLVINSRRTFARGAHERNFYALSRGAVIATEASSFLAEDIERGLGMVRLADRPADIDAALDALCADPHRLDTLRSQGLEHYVQRHGWKERMGRVITAVKTHLG